MRENGDGTIHHTIILEISPTRYTVSPAILAQGLFQGEATCIRATSCCPLEVAARVGVVFTSKIYPVVANKRTLAAYGVILLKRSRSTSKLYPVVANKRTLAAYGVILLVDRGWKQVESAVPSKQEGYFPYHDIFSVGSVRHEYFPCLFFLFLPTLPPFLGLILLNHILFVRGLLQIYFSDILDN